MQNKGKQLLLTILALLLVVNLLIFFGRWLDYNFTKKNLFEEESWSFSLPLVFYAILILLFIVPQLFKFRFVKGQKIGVFGFSLLIFIWLVFTTGFAQDYFINAFSTITTLNKIEAIDQQPVTRFYKLNECALNRVATSSFVRYTKLKGQGLNMDIYFAIPIFSKGNFTVFPQKSVWYGIRFNKVLKNWVDRSKTDSAAKSFYNECRDELNIHSLDRISYLIRKPNARETTFFLKAIERRLGIVPVNTTILIQPLTEEFEERNRKALTGLSLSLLVGLCLVVLAFFKKNSSLRSDETVQ